MIAFLRLIGMVLLIELLFYGLLTVYLRSTRREALEDAWDQRHPDRAGDGPERRRFVRRAMAGFRKTLRARLAFLVLVLPVVAIAAIIILVNYN